MSPTPETLTQLAAMPSVLIEMAAAFTGESARRQPVGGGFSFVQHVWHLADLEREGYGERIGRLRREDRPLLPDFDGDRIARERDYQARSVSEGVAAFVAARRANLAALAEVSGGAWDRAGEQEKLGPVRLRDIPEMMRQHDAEHREEIGRLMGERVDGAGTLASR